MKSILNNHIVSTLFIVSALITLDTTAQIDYGYTRSEPWTCLAKWNNAPIKTPEDLCLLFQGDILKNENGMYCFNVMASPLGFYILVTSPEHIQYIVSPEVTNVSNLVMRATEDYELYWIHATDSKLDSDSLEVTRVYFAPNENERCVIPPHTLIMPLAPSFIDVQAGAAEFMRTKAKRSSILVLPTIKFKENNGSATLQAAVDRSRLGLLNLKPIHGVQARDIQVVGPTKISRVR